jgi:hypothetical protein
VHTFKLDFLGKDSIRYTNEITVEKVRKGEEQNFKRVVENIIKFKAAALARQHAKHGQAEDIFELTPSDLNDHLRVRACSRGCAASLRLCLSCCAGLGCAYSRHEIKREGFSYIQRESVSG